MNLWGGRFGTLPDSKTQNYTHSLYIDYVLAEYDVLGSLAHVRMLEKSLLIPSADAQLILKGLRSILAEIRTQGIDADAESEDIHSYVEQKLYGKIGEAAGNMHLGRSRNDQVALDLRLYLRKQIVAICSKLITLNNALLRKAGEHLDTILPGYTHLQHAEPVRLAHHLLAYCSMFSRDWQRLMDSWKRCNTSPLGAGALAGSAVDRNYTAELLNFEGLCENSMDAVSSRDFIIEFLANISLIAMHISRISEEIILWSSREFSFIELDDAYCTGSSMLPQKKNPDIAELARGKTGRIYAALINLLTTLKGLPLTYNRDMQEDKEPLFDAVETISSTLDIFAPMIETMYIKKENMLLACTKDFSNATEIANYLTRKGIPFRRAHNITGKIVLYCIQKGISPEEMQLEEYAQFSDQIEDDLYTAITVGSVVEAHTGGTARSTVTAQIQKQKDIIKAAELWIQKHEKLLTPTL